MAAFFAAAIGPAMIAINVSQLLKLPPGTTREFDFQDEPFGLAPEVEVFAPLEGHARLLRTARGILASTEYRTTVRQSCGRCLGPATSRIVGSSNDEFIPRLDVVTGMPTEERAESPELHIDERHVLDLTEVLRQDLLTRLPLQPLCQPDCPGLCSECGRELRSGPCSCQPTIETNSPFAALAELLQREGPGNLSSNH